MKHGDDMVRFMAKVEVIPFVECWLWVSSLSHNGYGLFAFEGKNSRAHRWLWERMNGKIPHGMVTDHLCRVRNCVRPSHIEIVTQLINVRRGKRGSGRRLPPCEHPPERWDMKRRRCLDCEQLSKVQRRSNKMKSTTTTKENATPWQTDSDS